MGRLPYMEPVDGRIGYVAREQVQDSIELQIESGLVTGGLSPDDIWTDELVDEINQIDLGEVEKRAKEHRTG